MVKRVVCALLCCVMLIVSLPMAAYAENASSAANSDSSITIYGTDGEITPYYTYTSSMMCALSISGGTATCTVTLNAYPGVKTIYIRMYLEKKTLWWWNEVGNFNQLFTDEYASMSRQLAASGGTFRVRAVATVTGSDGNYRL